MTSDQINPPEVTEFIPGRTWIYGDSYGLAHNQGWTGLLEKSRITGLIVNRCQGGTSVADAYYELIKDLRKERIFAKDRVILVLSDKHRVFRNNITHQRNRLWGDDDSIKLNMLLYNACIRDAVAELARHRVDLMIVWSFPSNYPGDSDLFNGHVGVAPWNEEFADIDVDDYGYFWGADHVDQIRPALYHYSLLEHSYNNMKADRRPNHIEDPEIHQKLLVATTDWILGKWHGVRDLRNDGVQSWAEVSDQYGLNEIKIRLDLGPSQDCQAWTRSDETNRSDQENQNKAFEEDKKLSKFLEKFKSIVEPNPRPMKWKKWKPKRDRPR